MTEEAKPKMSASERMARARAARAAKRAAQEEAAPPFVERLTPLQQQAAARAHALKHPKMKAKPNWEDMGEEVEGADRFHIPQEMIPDGFDLQWVTDTVYGQPFTQHRAKFEKRGWTPVHPSDFDHRFDGMFAPKGADGEINQDGLVLMARPLELSIKSRARQQREARLPVQIKEQQIYGGDLPGVTLDSHHKSVRNTINKTVERIEIPSDE